MAIYLSEQDVRQVLTMPIALEQVERAFSDRALGLSFDIPRQRTKLAGGHQHILQAAAPPLNVVGYKAYYIKPGRSRSSLVHLIDKEDGRLEAIVEADWMGTLRTGASTGIAAKYLARQAAGVLGLFGYGRHAATQLDAVSRVRRLTEVKVFGRDATRTRAFCTEFEQRLGIPVGPATPEHTVRGSDMIVVMTKSAEPLFDGNWLEPGQFVAAAGSNALDKREIDLATAERADLIVVDSRDVARNECGDLLSAVEAGIVHIDTLPDLGEIVAGRRTGRTDDNQVILYESHGMGIQDLYTAARVLDLARARGLGTALPMA